MKNSLIAFACVAGFAIGLAIADTYPYPDDPVPGGGACGLNAGCLDRTSFASCGLCCNTNCPGSNNCWNACYNRFCRDVDPTVANGCPFLP